MRTVGFLCFNRYCSSSAMGEMPHGGDSSLGSPRARVSMIYFAGPAEKSPPGTLRRGGREAEGGGLLNRCMG